MHLSRCLNKTLPGRGFTLLELMIVVAIISILAMVTIPSTLNKRLRAEVASTLQMAKPIRDDITGYYRLHQSFPADNAAAGLPEPEQMIGNKFTRVEIENGAIHITFGNRANKALQEKILSLRPAVVSGSPASPISWLCGNEEPVEGMEAVGENLTDLSDTIVPVSCSY